MEKDENKANRKYPEYFVNGDRFKIFKIFDDSDNYKEDLAKARRFAKRINGEIYTEIDSNGTGVAFEKGVNLVNRLGYAVVRYKA